jgi:hypothetical protein
MAVDVMAKVRAAERELANLGKPDPLTTDQGIVAARGQLQAARERFNEKQAQEKAADQVARALGAEYRAYEKALPPFADGPEAVKAWVTARNQIGEALREASSWAQLLGQHVHQAQLNLVSAREGFLSAVDRAYGQATKEPAQMLGLLSDWETDRKDHFKAKLARIREDWQPIIERAIAEANG